MIIDRLIEQIKLKENPTVVGLDPLLEFIPNFILDKNYQEFGKNTKAVSSAFYEFNKAIIDSVYDIIPAVKPQIAMYEAYGIEGLKAYMKTCNYAKEKGLIVIGDIKRGDIFSTASAYAKAHIGKVSSEDLEYGMFDHDFITLNPYLGSDSIEPFLEECQNNQKGIFVLAKTSNPTSFEIQDLLVNEVPIYEKVASLISKWGENLIGKNGFSSVGAVVGATYKNQAKRLREVMPNTFFLVPGYGAQGASAEDIACCFDKNGLGALINSSRGIIFAYKNDKEQNEHDFAILAREACIKMKKDLRRVI